MQLAEAALVFQLRGIANDTPRCSIFVRETVLSERQSYDNRRSITFREVHALSSYFPPTVSRFRFALFRYLYHRSIPDSFIPVRTRNVSRAYLFVRGCFPSNVYTFGVYSPRIRAGTLPKHG